MARVLIADDSAFMRRVLKEILSDGGYNVVSECKNGLEAVENYKNDKPDLVLMDFNMPKMNGIDASKYILNHDSSACVVMVTSVVGKKKILDALRVGVKNYITKPFENNTFLSTLGKVMGDKTPKESCNVEEDDEFQVIGSFFGQFLLQKSIITKDQLLKILEIQSAVNRKIGQLAVDEGFLIKDNIEKVLKVQRRINKCFGQLAIQMGMLEQSQVDYLLEQQQKHFVSIEEIILREKILPKDKLEKELEMFRRLDEEDQGVFNMKWVSNHIHNGFIFETFIEQTLKLIMRLAGIFVMEGECSFDRQETISNGIIIRIHVSGDFNWHYFLNLSENLTDQIVNSMLEDDESIENYKDISVDAANEFVNIVCGNAVSKLDNKGIKFEIAPPKTARLPKGEKISFGEKEQVLTVPILVPEGEMELAIVGANIFRPIEK